MDNFKTLEKTIGIAFHNKTLLQNAFIHRSYLNEHKHFFLLSNEKLEFLGDSVLSVITSIYLYKNYPHLHEGEYTDIKAAIVKTESLCKAAEMLGLQFYLKISKGQEKNKGRYNQSLLADCFEALIASIFLDQGFDASYQFVLKFLFDRRLDHIIAHKLYLSPKNRLQEYWQNKYKKLPHYLILTQAGPEHKKRYHIGIFLDGNKIGEGEGRSKKIAEECAAANALQKLKDVI